MEEISKIRLNGKSAALMSFDRKRLYETMKRKNGALNRILEWIKDENPRGYSPDGVKIGGEKDDFAISYYADGMIYRVMRDGRCLVSSADIMRRCDAEREELQSVVETIIADDIVEMMRDVTYGSDARVIAAKPNDTDSDGRYDTVVAIIQG